MTTKEILRSFKKIVVVGLSPNTNRPSHTVTQYLIDAGFEITGVRPNSGPILGRPVFSSLEDVPQPIEIVNVFRDSSHVPEIVESAIQVGARGIWLQVGVQHREAEARAKAAGLFVVSDLCIKMEYLRWSAIDPA